MKLRLDPPNEQILVQGAAVLERVGGEIDDGQEMLAAILVKLAKRRGQLQVAAPGVSRRLECRRGQFQSVAAQPACSFICAWRRAQCPHRGAGDHAIRRGVVWGFVPTR